VRTIVVSDLHLGAHREVDVLRRDAPLRALCAALDGVDRLVLLGDALELRQAPVRDVLLVALPAIAAIGAALGPGAELVLVTGNHDHHLIAQWLDRRGLDAAAGPLALEQFLSDDDIAADPALRTLAAAARPARLRIAYPGLWLRDDVYAMHGHYLDRLTTLPTMERLALGAMTQVVGPVPEGRGAASVEHFEAALRPIYAWMHAIAQTPAGVWSAGGQTTSARTWKLLTGDGGRRTLRGTVLATGFPLAIAALNRARLGPLQADISGHQLRRTALRAFGEVVWRLGVDADHVIFGHTHRAGPLPGDDPFEWQVHGSATSLHNPGSWVVEPILATGDPDGPYHAGRAILVDDDGSPPRLQRLVSDLG
jgi:hypothetical protein